jgi:hypothetical protein
MAEPQISRKQAWCKLAILIAEGLPDPNSISFNAGDSSIFTIHVDTIAAYRAWMNALGCTSDTAHPQADGRVQHQGIGHGTWHGCTAWIYAYLPASKPEPVDEDMTAVRAAADPTCVCCSPDDCGDRRGHVRNDRNGAYQCNCGRDWPCEKAAAG